MYVKPESSLSSCCHTVGLIHSAIIHNYMNLGNPRSSSSFLYTLYSQLGRGAFFKISI